MFTVYKITNLVNSKYYIGVHETDDAYDDYMGSGPAIKNAIKKYGIESFKKEILFIFDDEASAYAKEKELLKDVWQLRECYNMTEGGVGSWSHVDSSGKNNCMKRPEVVKKVFESRRKTGTTEAMRAAANTNGKKGSEKRKGSKDSEETKRKRNASVKLALANEETRKKLKDNIRLFRCVPYTLIDPNGTIYNTDVISELCAELNIPLSTVVTHADGSQIKRGKLKGWTIHKKGGSN